MGIDKADVRCELQRVLLERELTPQSLYITRFRGHSRDIIKRLVVLDVMARTLIVSSVSGLLLQRGLR